MAKLTDFAYVQESGKMGSVAESAVQRSLRAALRRDHMRPIAEVAKQRLRDVPQFSALRMPSSKATSGRLVAAATAMADAAKVHEAVFREVGLPDDFIAAMITAAGELTASRDERNQHATRRSGATAGLAAEERRGRSMLPLIDAIVLPRLRTDALRAEWRKAKKVPKKTGPLSTLVAEDQTTVAA